MTELMLHAGATHATLDQVKMTPTPRPTKTHEPVPHGEIIAEIKKLAGYTGFEITDEHYGIQDGKDRDTGEVMPGAKMFGVMTLDFQKADGMPATNEVEAAAGAMVDKLFSVQLGVRNSHDKSFRFELVLGSRVFVCDNLCFSGELSVCRKHTGGIRGSIVPAILEGFERLPDTIAGQELRFERYKALKLPTSFANDYMVRVMQAGVIAPSRLQDAVNEFHNPSFDHGPPTLYRAFQAVTETHKGKIRIDGGKEKRVGVANVFELPAIGRALHALTDDYAHTALDDNDCPEPDAEIIAKLLKTAGGALALAV